MNPSSPRERSNRLSSYDLSSVNVDAILAKELNKLSVRDRTIIQEEIHGVQSLALDETPARVNISLKALQKGIDEFNDAPRRQAFDEAMRTPLSLVHRKKFRLQFLRADLFDAKKACWRMMTHVRLLKKYFGLVALERQLCFSDLPKKDQATVRKGYIQILPSRDRAGRLVLVDYDNVYALDDTTEMIPQLMRIMLYFISVMAEDVDTQRKGVVVIAAPTSKLWSRYQKAPSEEKRDLADHNQSFPIRLGAVHLCLPDGPTSKFLRGLIALGVLGEEGRMRIRVHKQLSSLETQYELLSFGLPVREIPLSNTGSIKTRNHLQWIKMRTVLEKHRAADSNHPENFNVVIHPSLDDVLFSKGGNTNHYGNMEFRHVLDFTCPIYNSTTDRNERRQLRQHIIDFVTKERKGRFLQSDPTGNGWWVVISDPAVLLEKVGTALYDHNRKVLARAALQVTSSEMNGFSVYRKRRKLCNSTLCGIEKGWSDIAINKSLKNYSG